MIKGTEPKQQPAKKEESWMMSRVGKPVMYIGLGFILCKIFDAYTENKRVKRLQ